MPKKLMDKDMQNQYSLGELLEFCLRLVGEDKSIRSILLRLL